LRVSRQLGDERARYRRLSLREQLDELLAWPATHRIAAALIVAVLIIGLLLAFTGGLLVAPESLAVGDCLFVRTSANQADARPIGEIDEVSATLVAGGAERASCSASHGHEVSAIVFGPTPSVVRGELRAETLDADAIRRVMQPLCDAAFAGYVGRSLAGSRYVTFPVAPQPQTWIAEGGRTICLVARADGEWMDHPARESGE
jgi:hypothetical protein